MKGVNRMQKDAINHDKAMEEKKKKRSDLNAVLSAVLGTSDRNIAIEFECGGCCKKVMNGQEIDVIGNFVILKPTRNEELLVKLFSAGTLVEQQTAQAIIIPIDHICAIEFGAVELDDECVE